MRRSRDSALRLAAHRNFSAVNPRIWKNGIWLTGSRLYPSLFRIFSAAVSEDDSVSNDRRLGLVHVARNPGRLQCKLHAFLHDFERRNGAMRDGTVFDRVFVLGMFGTPEWSQNPARSFRVFPTCHRTPHTACEIG